MILRMEYHHRLSIAGEWLSCLYEHMNGGEVTEAMKELGWCETHYIDMMPLNSLRPVGTAANLYFGDVVPNYAWLEERT